MFTMEVEITRKRISVYGLCDAQGDLVYVGRWMRGSALELYDRFHGEVDYEWWKDCIYVNDALYLFGYRAGVVKDLTAEKLYVIKTAGHIGAGGIAYDGKVFYVIGLGGLYIFDRDLRLVEKVNVKGLRDVAIGDDGTVYVLGERALYVYEEKLRPVYKLSNDSLIGYYVAPHGDDIYVSSLTNLVRLDRSFKEKAFTPRMSRSFAVLDDYIVSAYDNVIAVADRDTLSISDRRYVFGLSAGASKMGVIDGKAFVPVYFEDGTAVLTLSV